MICKCMYLVLIIAVSSCRLVSLLGKIKPAQQKPYINMHSFIHVYAPPMLSADVFCKFVAKSRG